MPLPVTSFCSVSDGLAFIGPLRINSNDPVVTQDGLQEQANSIASAIRARVIARGQVEPYVSEPLKRLTKWLNAKQLGVNLAGTKAQSTDPNLLGIYRSLAYFQQLEWKLFEAGQLDLAIYPENAEPALPDGGFLITKPSAQCSVDQLKTLIDGYDPDNIQDFPSRTIADDWLDNVLNVIYLLAVKRGYAIPGGDTLTDDQTNLYTDIANKWCRVIVLQARVWAGKNLGDTDIEAYNLSKEVRQFIDNLQTQYYDDLFYGDYVVAPMPPPPPSPSVSPLVRQVFEGFLDSSGNFAMTGVGFTTLLPHPDYTNIVPPLDSNSALYTEIVSSTSAVLHNRGGAANQGASVIVDWF